MKLLRVILFFVASAVYGETIVGTWQMTSEPKKPFNFASIISYKTSFKFNADGTLKHLANEANLMGSIRYYSLNGDKLEVYLKNPNQGQVNNMALGMFSSKTFEIQSIGNNCYKGTEVKDTSNVFTMCKIKS